MNGMTNSDEVVECPLCMEALEVDDLNFFPCTCGYQICRFCWHRIRTDENELCPACRKAYSENPADFTPLSQEQVSCVFKTLFGRKTVRCVFKHRTRMYRVNHSLTNYQFISFSLSKQFLGLCQETD